MSQSITDSKIERIVSHMEQLLFAGDDLFMSQLIEKLGGFDSVYGELVGYPGQCATSELNLWIEKISARLLERNQMWD